MKIETMLFGKKGNKASVKAYKSFVWPTHLSIIKDTLKVHTFEFREI